jgi:hypothetical protein
VDWIWTLVGFILTLLIFSYLFGDNPLFRLVSYLFVGVTAGYFAVLLVYQVLLPRLIWPLLQGSVGGLVLALPPLILGVLLLTKLSSRIQVAGSIPVAYLVGVGVAVMIGGAIVGTIIGQVRASIHLFPEQSQANPLVMLIEGIVLLIGTIGTLVYFQFGASSKLNQPPRRQRLVEMTSNLGQIFLAITLGALFAGVYGAAITALIDRLSFIQDYVTRLIF